MTPAVQVALKLASSKTGRKVIGGVLLLLLGLVVLFVVCFGSLFAVLMGLSLNGDLYYPLINSTRITEPYDPDRVIIHEYEVEVEKTRPVLDEEGNPVLDEDGEVVTETYTETEIRREEIESPHWGVDFEVREGSYVVACAGGVVKRVYHDDEEGNVVEIEHADAKNTTRYLHLENVLVSVGQDVILGQPLGKVGLSGECTPYRESETNVHLEVLDASGEPIDPAGVLKPWGQYLDIPTELVKEVAGAEWQDWMVSEIEGDIVWNGEAYMWPVPGHTRISSPFGSREMDGEQENHSGIDIPAPAGTPIYAAAPGVVSTNAHWSYGICVRINHGNGYQTMYAHMSGIVVSRGEYVEKGELIGFMGSTGRSTGTHLHFEIYINGTRVNPMGYVG